MVERATFCITSFVILLTLNIAIINGADSDLLRFTAAITGIMFSLSLAHRLSKDERS